MGKESSLQPNRKPSAKSPKRAPTPQAGTPESVPLEQTLNDPSSASPRQVLRLQQAAGNRAVQRLLARGAIQAKLNVGPAGDKYEQEADRVASQVMGMTESATPAVQRQKPEEEETVQTMPDVQLRREDAGEGFEVGGEVEGQLAANSGGGQALPTDTRSFMENRFGADFGNVRVHTGEQASDLNRSMSAQAFTHGSDIYFGEGKYNPDASSGKQLLAHELTHVIQQGSAAQTPEVSRKVNDVSAGELAPGSRLQLARSKAGRVMGSWLGPILGGLLLPLTLAAKGARAGGNKALGRDPATGRQRTMGNASWGRRLGAIGLGALGGLAGLLGGAILGPLLTGLNLATAGLGGAYLSNMAANMTFGEQNERQGGGGGGGLVNCHFVPFIINPVNVGEVGTWRIRGRRYVPNNAVGPGAAKVIILYSGSGGTNEDQLGPLADYYCGQGSRVYGANYRGYGTSVHDTNAVGNDDSMLSESGIYEDAYRIYQFVVANAGVGPDNIILHGFSLGGAIASHLAKRLAKEGVRLGGLVLHSSIDTAYTQADKGTSEMGGGLGAPLGPIAAMGNMMAAGSFDTPSHLRELAVHDPNLPIHTMSGSSANGDQLALGETGLDQNTLTGYGFNTVSEYEGSGGHLNTTRHAPGNAIGDPHGIHQGRMGNLLGRGARAQAVPSGILKRLQGLFA